MTGFELVFSQIDEEAKKVKSNAVKWVYGTSIVKNNNKMPIFLKLALEKKKYDAISYRVSHNTE